MTARATTPPSGTQPLVPNKVTQTKRFALLMAISLLIGAGAGYPVGRLIRGMHPANHLSPWTIPAVIFMVPLALALHEAGHVIAGLSAGFRFHLFVAGPLRIQRDGDRITFGLNRIASLWGGVAACTPQTFGPELAGKMLQFTAGGPVFSALGAIMLWPAFVLRNTSPNAAACLLVLGFISAALCFATLMPMRFGGFVSDGGRILMLLRGSEEGRRWIGLAGLSGLSLAERPRNWPPQLFDMLGDSADGSPDAPYSDLLRHLWKADLREWDAAQASLERCLAQIECLAPPMRSGFYMAAAYFYARQLNDATTARTHFNKAEGPGVHQKSDLHIVRAAVLLAEGRSAEALPELDLAVASLRNKAPSATEPLHEDIAAMRNAALLNSGE